MSYPTKAKNFLSFSLLTFLGVFLGHSSVADTSGHPRMDMALNFLVQAQAITDTTDIANAQQTALLTEALKLLGEEPDNDSYHGHLGLAFNQTNTALNGLKANKSSDEVHKAIGQAIAEMHAAVPPENSASPAKDGADVPKTPVTPPPTPPPPAASTDTTSPPPLAPMVPPPDPGYLKNSDFKDGLTSWHGDGEEVFLKVDGSEGTETDPDVTPVIKLALTHGQSRLVSQEIDLRNKPPTLHAQVEMYASKDFQRSKFPNDYTYLESFKIMWLYGNYVPDVDFWIRLGPGLQYGICIYTTTEAKPGQWTTLKATWGQGEKPYDHFSVNFCVPPGDGFVYLKNPSATP